MAGKDFSRFLKRSRGGSRLVEEAKAKAAAEKAARQGSESFNPLEVKPALSDADKLASLLHGSKNKGALSEGFSKDNPVQAPYVITDEDKALVQKIFDKAREDRTPNYQPATNPVFDKADPELTKRLVRQESVANRLPPKPSVNDKLPANERSRPILEHENLIGQRIASKLGADTEEPLNFYATGTILQGLMEKAGLSPEEAMAFMREWAGQGAATSPRTATPSNMRNASYLLFRDAMGDRLTPQMQRFEQDQATHGFPSTHNMKPGKDGEAPKAVKNRAGYPMMEMHTDLSDKFFNGTVDPWNNPKPYTFKENWSGNMADATADTHYIRGILSILDEMNPGGIPRGWFKNDAVFDRYRSEGGFPQGPLDVGAINDKLAGQKLGGRHAQTEYPILQGPSNAAAELMGLSPAEIQERLWFALGPKTGLQSPRMALPDLFNSQLEYTGGATGLSPEDIMKLWARKRIPLAENEPLDIPGESAVG